MIGWRRVATSDFEAHPYVWIGEAGASAQADSREDALCAPFGRGPTRLSRRMGKVVGHGRLTAFTVASRIVPALRRMPRELIP